MRAFDLREAGGISTMPRTDVGASIGAFIVAGRGRDARRALLIITTAIGTASAT